MNKPNGFDTVAASLSFEPLKLGGHVCVIKGVEETKSKTGKDMLKVALDIGGDDKQAGFRDLAERRGADEVIVLISAFTVDGSGRCQGLNPNSTYKGWNWILMRDKGGPWKHMDHGYG